jgi:hypothetical protein
MASGLALLQIQIQTLFLLFQTKSNGACMETTNFALHLCQYKFTLWKVKANKKV